MDRRLRSKTLGLEEMQLVMRIRLLLESPQGDVPPWFEVVSELASG